MPPPGAASVVAAVPTRSLTWIGLMIQEGTFGIGISLEWASGPSRDRRGGVVRERRGGGYRAGRHRMPRATR